MNKKLIPIALIALSTPALTGCVEAALTGAVATGAAIVDDRSVGGVVDDNVIWTHIKHLYLQKDVNDIFSGVSVQVNDGRVLLTGNVKLPDNRVEAVRLAWQPAGVKEVINEIQIKDQSSINDYANDVWIATQIRGKLLIAKDIKSINYSIDVVNGVVYLMGISQNNQELRKVSNLASTVRGVKRVVSHARMRSAGDKKI